MRLYIVQHMRDGTKRAAATSMLVLGNLNGLAVPPTEGMLGVAPHKNHIYGKSQGVWCAIWLKAGEGHFADNGAAQMSAARRPM